MVTGTGRSELRRKQSRVHLWLFHFHKRGQRALHAGLARLPDILRLRLGYNIKKQNKQRTDLFFLSVPTVL